MSAGNLIDTTLSLRSNIEAYQASSLMHICLDERCLTQIFTQRYLQDTYYKPLALLQGANPNAAIDSQFWNVFYDWIGDPDESHVMGITFYNRTTPDQMRLIASMAKLELNLAVKLNDPTFDDWQTRMVRQVRQDAQKWPEYELKRLDEWRLGVETEIWTMISR